MDLDISRDEAVETLVAAGIFGGGVLLALLLAGLLRLVVHRFTRATRAELDDRIVRRIRVPFVLLVAVQALAIALRTLSYLDERRDDVEQGWVVLSLVLGVVLVQRVAIVLLHWYAADARRLHASAVDRALPLVQRLVTFTIVAIGLVLVLDELGVSVGPLLTGLGLTGLAIALAVQPTLTGFFAGSSVVSDASIGVGDFIEVENGPSGRVTDVGWRATRIVDLDDRQIVIPNSRVATSIVTKSPGPGANEEVAVECRVAYDEDLDRVERVVREELTRLRSELDGVDRAAEPGVAFLSFGESDVRFSMSLRASHARAGAVTHEMIKRVHGRFAREGIALGYPARRVVVRAGDAPGLESPRTQRDARRESADA
jgi:small-conductance mechanosensitive channel